MNTNNGRGEGNNRGFNLDLESGLGKRARTLKSPGTVRYAIVLNYVLGYIYLFVVRVAVVIRYRFCQTWVQFG